jgi:LysM repeat protein
MQTYTVKSGDTLSKISTTFYGNWSGVDAIAKANGITNVNLIYPGQKISIPDKAGVTNSAAAVVEEAVVIPEEETKRSVWPWLALAAAIGGGYYYYKKRKAKTKAPALSGTKSRKKRK